MTNLDNALDKIERAKIALKEPNAPVLRAELALAILNDETFLVATPSPRERDTCANCEKPIHYEADLQSWRHDDDDYDRCRMAGKYFAEPATTSSSEPDSEFRDGLWCACGDIAWVGWAGEGLTPISAGGSVHQPVKPCFYDDLRAATPSPREPMISRAAAIEIVSQARTDWMPIISSARPIFLEISDGLANLPALDAQPDITKEWLDGLIDGLFLDTDTAVEMRRFGAEQLSAAILRSLKGGE